MIPDEWDTFCFRLGWMTGALHRGEFVDFLKTKGVTSAEIEAGYQSLMKIVESFYRRPSAEPAAIPERVRPAD